MTPASPPAASPANPAPDSVRSLSRTEQLPDGRLKIGPLLLDAARGTLDVPATVNMNRGVIEVMACAPWGKAHESLLVLGADPSVIQVGLLLLLGLPPDSARRAAPPDQDYRPHGPPLRIHLLRADSLGREREFPVEDWICRADSGAGDFAPTMSEGDWTFTGSILDSTGFAAQREGNVVVTYIDPAAMVDNPRPSGTNDDAYVICPGLVPARGTPVTLRFLRKPPATPGR